jgi:hypothetical protein
VKPGTRVFIDGCITDEVVAPALIGTVIQDAGDAIFVRLDEFVEVEGHKVRQYVNDEDAEQDFVPQFVHEIIDDPR